MNSIPSYQPKKLCWYHSLTFKNCVAFFIITTIGQGILIYNYVSDSTNYEISQQTILMEYVALKTSNSLDTSAVTTFRRPSKMQTESYQKTQQLLRDIRQESGVDNVIIIRRNVKGDYYYVVDDRKNFQLGMPVHIHPQYPATKEAAERVWQTGQPDRSETFGPPGSHWIQVLAPIQHLGKVDALLLVNKNADALVAAKEWKAYSIFGWSNLILIIGLGLFILFSRRMLRPLGFLQEQSMEVAKGDLQVAIPKISRHDEVGELNNTFIYMIQALDHAQTEATKNWQLKLEESEKVLALNETFKKFVPHEFLECLQKEQITDIQIGDHVRLNMSILFADIRSFTTLSEKLTPAENFRFINSYLEVMGPVIRKQGGFIDKYIGDAIMALFGKSADDALQAAIAMRQLLYQYNAGRQQAEYIPIEIGIGIHTGPLMLGTIGEHHRMEGTVIGDAVNLASRIEGITKLYDVSILVSENTVKQLEDKALYALRIVDHVRVKGKAETVTIFEAFDGDLAKIREDKFSTMDAFETALSDYFDQKFEQAEKGFHFCLEQCPQDTVSQMYIQRCQQAKQRGALENWTGVTVLDWK